jgi:electron-transferring-flavoprotein dehydrogenase
MASAPSEFPPPFDASDHIGPPTDAPEERLEVGVAIVGGGPAGLACANRLMQLLEDEPELTEKLGEVPVAVIEKGKVCGAHNLSGANVVPSALHRLFPDEGPDDWGVYQEVDDDAVYLLTKKRALPLVPMPPNYKNHGNYPMSVSKLSRLLADRAEEAGAYLLTETVADKLLVEDRIVRGIRSGDKGRGRDGEELANFEPGSDLMAKATVLAEGTVSHQTQCAVDHFDLKNDSPRWEIGVKEVWKVPKPLDRVIHTMNWPLRARPKYNEFGGSFIYPMGEDKLCIGMVVGLDTTDATFSCHDALQQLKTHSFIKDLLEGGERIGWGAKTIPSGGYWTMPKRLSVPGMVMCGDNVSMVNVPYLKGIHYAMHAGMYAAEAIVESLKQDSVNFEEYERQVKKSEIEKDLYKSRNVRQYGDKGFVAFGGIANAWLLSGGAIPPGHKKVEPDSDVDVEVGKAAEKYPSADGNYIFDKLSSVFLSGNATRDDAPNHVRIQERVPREVAQTWVSMCPAQVYEIPEDQLESGAETVDVNVTASNCVQCGAITAKGGRLTLPEGGDGPLYTET